MLLSSQCLNEPGTLGGDPPPPGGYLAMIWVGMCGPGFQIWTSPFLKKLHSK